MKADKNLPLHSEPDNPLDSSGTSRAVLVRVSHATHKLLRIRVAEEDTSIQEWVERLIIRELNGSRHELTDAFERAFGVPKPAAEDPLPPTKLYPSQPPPGSTPKAHRNDSEFDEAFSAQTPADRPAVPLHTLASGNPLPATEIFKSQQPQAAIQKTHKKSSHQRHEAESGCHDSEFDLAFGLPPASADKLSRYLKPLPNQPEVPEEPLLGGERLSATTIIGRESKDDKKRKP